jgi:hypothetical protein
MNSIEDSVRLELIQLGGVLVLDRPKPGEELVYDSVRYIMIDFRDVFGEWQSLARSGESLLIKFGDNTSIKLDHFFNKGVGAPTEVLVQIGYSVVISPDTFFDTYASLEEQRAADTGPIPGGAWFLPTPLVLPVGDDDPSPLLGDENPLVPDDPIPEVTSADEDLFEIDSPSPPPDTRVPPETPPESISNVAIVNAVFGSMSQPPLD